MLLQMPGTCTLKDVDDFLRARWLERGFRLSVSTIGGTK